MTNDASPSDPWRAWPDDALWDHPRDHARPAITDDVRVDVAVVGAGIVGATTALLLAEAGRSVALLEGGVVGTGTTGRSTGKITALQGARYRTIVDQHGEEAARIYARAQLDALDWMDQQVRDHGIDCGWERRRAVTFALSDEGRSIVESEAAAAAAAGLDVSHPSSLDLPLPVTAAAALDDQAQMDPRRYVEGLAARLDALPTSTVYENSRVTDIRPGRPHRLSVGEATVRADLVVIATLLPTTARGLFFARAKPMGSLGVAVRLDGAAPSDMSINVDSPTWSLRGVNHGGHDLLLVVGEGAPVATGPARADAARRLEDRIRSRFPVSEIVAAWSAHDHVPADHLPWVGPVSRTTPTILTATGFEKWGLAMGTAAARLLAERVADGSTGNGWGVFSTSRLALRSIPEIAKIDLQVGARLAADWIWPDSGPDQRGDGARSRKGLRPVGHTHSGDDDHADDGDGPARSTVSVVCTHLGGVCRWNDLDRTWDCPLHGSRFAADGSVIAGPAVEPLQGLDGS